MSNRCACRTHREMEGDGTWKAVVLRTRAHRVWLENFKRIESNGMHMRASVQAGIGVRTHGRAAPPQSRQAKRQREFHNLLIHTNATVRRAACICAFQIDSGTVAEEYLALALIVHLYFAQ